MCLASVLSGFVLPNKIQIRFEGKFPSFGNFYLEQLSCLAKIRGVEWEMFIAPSEGVRKARDWHLKTCDYTWLWMGDDDVIYDADCLSWFIVALGEINGSSPPQENRQAHAYLAGIKVDASSLRGYPDYDTKVYPEYPAPQAPLNHLYTKPIERPVKQQVAYPTTLLDAGNCLLNAFYLETHGVNFAMFPDSENAGGEDTLFAELCAHKKLAAFAVPLAQSIHLEKPKAFFSEFEARKELIKRSKQCLGF